MITIRVQDSQTRMQGSGSKFSKSDYMKSAPKPVIYCAQPHCIIYFIFIFFTMYHILLDPVASVEGLGQHNLIALLITADGAVILSSSV